MNTMLIYPHLIMAVYLSHLTDHRLHLLVDSKGLELLLTIAGGPIIFARVPLHLIVPLVVNQLQILVVDIIRNSLLVMEVM